MKTFAPVLVLVPALAAAVLPAHADDHGPRIPLPGAYVQECASCHAPYPPGLLPAASWRRLMADLPNHFGSDASLDAATQAQLASWLVAHAASGRRARGTPPEDRITRSDWFVREHREVGRSTWSRASIGSAANCAACHRDAAQGRFDEDAVQIPR